PEHWALFRADPVGGASEQKLVRNIRRVGVIYCREVYLAIRSFGDRNASTAPNQIARTARSVELEAGNAFRRDPEILPCRCQNFEKADVQIVCVAKIVERLVTRLPGDARAQRFGLGRMAGRFFRIACTRGDKRRQPTAERRSGFTKKLR